MSTELHINIDHVATLREARGTPYPSPVHAALVSELAGADGITAHLREDRRHIQDRDVAALRASVRGRFNLEMAPTEGMLATALSVRPDVVTLVPERREERTTEGGLDVPSLRVTLRSMVERLQRAGVAVSLFVAPHAESLRAAINLGPDAIELHTGDYANASRADARLELERLATGAELIFSQAPHTRIAAGHGLTATNVPLLLARVPKIAELNIGHALVSDALFFGLSGAVERFRRAMQERT